MLRLILSHPFRVKNIYCLYTGALPRPDVSDPFRVKTAIIRPHPAQIHS
jgi:hypothetical protein